MTFSTEPLKTEGIIYPWCFLGGLHGDPLLETKKDSLLGGDGRNDTLPAPSRLLKRSNTRGFCWPIQTSKFSTLLYLGLHQQADLDGLSQMSSLALWLPAESGQ